MFLPPHIVVLEPDDGGNRFAAHTVHGPLSIRSLNEMETWIVVVGNHLGVDGAESLVQQVDSRGIVVKLTLAEAIAELQHMQGRQLRGVMVRSFSKNVMIVIEAVELVTKLVVTPDPLVVSESAFKPIAGEQINAGGMRHPDIVIHLQHRVDLRILRHASEMAESPVDGVDEDNFVVVELEGQVLSCAFLLLGAVEFQPILYL